MGERLNTRAAVRVVQDGQRVTRRFCLGPFQDAVLHAASVIRRRRYGYKRAVRVTPKLVLALYGVSYEEFRAWLDWARYRNARAV